MRPQITKLRSFTIGVTMFMAAGYFTIHGLGLGGDKGYLSLNGYDHEISIAQAELAELQKKRKWLEHRVSLVNETEVDADLLGELARKQGGLYASDELIIDLN